MKRRDFLSLTAATLATTLFGNTSFLWAEGPRKRNIVVFKFVGGYDGLYLFPLKPAQSGDADYRSKAYNFLYGKDGVRKGLELSDDQILNIDAGSNIGLHAGWKPVLDEANIRLIGPLGIPYPTEVIKSHAECQLDLITGHLASPTAEGILGKVKQTYKLGPMAVVGLGRNDTQELVDPAGEILNVSNLTNYDAAVPSNYSYVCDDFKKTINNGKELLRRKDYDVLFADTLTQLKQVEGTGSGPIAEAFRNTHDTLKKSLVLVENCVRSVETIGDYGDTSFATICKDIARYFKADFSDPGKNPYGINPSMRIVQVNHNIWDTHKRQATVLPMKIEEASKNIAALIKDLKHANVWENTSLVFISEFGRTANINGGLGTDHGHGNIGMVVSGRFDTNKVIGNVTRKDFDANYNLIPTPELSFLTPLNEVFTDAGMPLDQFVGSQVKPGGHILREPGIMS